ncbi:hypothetical protein [Brevibacillus sp. BC25]|uniref:hypothetical protein n=1 Tax=Brevibacillus sp. BC25 TaxID=1144308 RepID=UPI00027121C1|nr:hypothetical protein [Brevibacillus sp. BC25]EJL27405.1 hypothetical protein PMI05_02740 [Brevibacillus sp. BC25]
MRTIFGIGKCKLLVTCSNVNGGLYVLDVKEENFQLTKLLTNNCRGIARWGEKRTLSKQGRTQSGYPSHK